MISPKTCVDPFFGGSDFVDAKAGTLKKLTHVNTCSTFLTTTPNPNDPVEKWLVKSVTLNNYCDGPSVPADLKSRVKGLRIRSVLRTPDSQDARPSFDSGCILSSDSSYIVAGVSSPLSGRQVRLPYLNVPFMIQTYEDTSCKMPLNTFSYLNGFAGDRPFDSMLFNDASGVRLLVPGDNGPRAVGPFMALMPQILDGSSGLPFLTAPASLAAKFHVPAGDTTKIIVNESSCSPSLSKDGVKILGVTCKDLGEVVEMTVVADGSPGLGSIVNFSTIGIYVFLPSELERHRVQKSMMELLGSTNQTGNDEFFNLNKGLLVSKEYGALSLARNVLGPQGAGRIGLDLYRFQFKDTTTTFKEVCENTWGGFEWRDYDPESMQERVFWIEIGKPYTASGSLICNDADPAEADCASNGQGFNKRIQVFDRARSMLPIVAAEFNCGSLLGRLETSIPDETKYERKLDQDILHWNTAWGAGSGKQRLEHLHWSTREVLSGSAFELKSERRRMARFVKTNTSGYEMTSFNFEADFDGSDWNSTLAAVSAANDGGEICYDIGIGAQLVTDRWDMFSTYSSIATRTPPSSGSTKFDLAAGNWPGAAGACNVGLVYPGPEKYADDLSPKANELSSAVFENKFQGEFLKP